MRTHSQGEQTVREPLQSRLTGVCQPPPHPRNGKGGQSNDWPWAALPTLLSSYDFHRLLCWVRGWLLVSMETPGGDTQRQGLSQPLAIIPGRFLGHLAFPPA